ncbi:Disulfide-isomerase, PDIA-3 Endoplasmic reticulum lumen [Chondrus crispus]|uniref:protein disulfide-isomerase n=1 Tax=Chondrus crispus TaxID=2769 RepID=R7Q3Q0_CHOCR|nr:Disulfide-isomerase, PDIA-3 Endoplasmic reticulum lumen [Chondrus crispus]CDF32649.1 Disulfide-isomerase, PDIA-3 Endoplasmic reticulum lumen [Chondrus crispus]|eukprot:XP_005712420.1 Disulfide-isomerase, PDIA-3 Endoplasmic reticulum lumen [Chondrus crispus]
MSFARLVLPALAVAFVASLAAADESDVVTLTSKNFADVVAKEKLVFVKFFAPWCGHCQSMAEDFKKTATELKGKAVLADVDATTEEELAKKYNIDGFPTLKLFADGEEVVDYNGGRDKESMIQFIERATVPPFSEIDSADAYKKFIADNKEKNILVGAELSPANFNKFRKAAFGLRDVMPDSMEFIRPKSAKYVSIDAYKADELYLLRVESDGTHRPMKYDTDSDESLEKFVKGAALPAWQEFTQENAELYTELSTPIIVGFFKDCEVAECKIMEKVAQKKVDNGKVVFAWVNAVTLASFLDYVGLKDAKTPVCGYAFESDARYLLPEGMEFTEKNFEAWVDDMIAGKVVPARKSEAIPDPSENTGPVYNVVGDSWSDEVEDSEKDVVIAQVAEWCGHCNKLKPIYKKVAEELKKASVNHIKFAMMDATENDAPDGYKAKGFPTIHFFPAGKEQKGIDFDAERTSKGIIEWLMEKTSKKFEFDVSTLGEDPVPEEDEEGGEEEGEDADADGAQDDDGMDELEEELKAVEGEEEEEKEEL